MLRCPRQPGGFRDGQCVQLGADGDRCTAAADADHGARVRDRLRAAAARQG